MERNQLKIFAKNLLGKQEYSRFKTALKSFEKTECILSFCVELLEMVNAPEKTELLVEVRKMLPKSKQSEFSKVCRNLVNERWTMREKRRMGYEVGFKENNDVFSSPAKRARRAKSRSKLRGHALKTGISNQQASPECSTLQQQQIISEVSYFSKCKRSVTLTTVPDRDENQNQSRYDPTARQELVDTRELQKDTKCKVVRMERESSTINFGFKIQGDLFTEQEIVVRQVDKNSIAERSGLRLGDRITKINGIECIRAMKSDIVAMIKSVNKLNLQVISNVNFKEAQNTNIHDEAVTIATSGQGYNTKQVTIYTDEDGWMGCSIRGGIDYDCEVHVISVEDGSPAESAGLRQGDIITEVNGVSLHGTTHVQAVEHILTASPPVTFTVKRNSSQCAGCHESGGVMQKPEYLQNDINNLPHTPLRSRGRKPRRSPSQQMAGTTAPPPPPGYWYDSSTSVTPTGGAIGSPSALHLRALHLDGTPPPPYTVNLPQMHRVIQMGGDVMANGTCTVSNHGNPGPFLPAESEMIFQRNFSSTPRPEGSHTTHQRELGIRNENFRDESISKESEVSSCNDNDSDSGAGLTENGHSAIQCDHADKGGVTSNSADDTRDAFFDSEAFTENLHSTIQQGSTKPDGSGSNEDDINDYTNIDRKTLSTEDYHTVRQEEQTEPIHKTLAVRGNLDRDNVQVNKTLNVNKDNRPCLLEAIRNFNLGLLKSTKNRNISFAPCKTRPSSGLYMNNCTTADSDTEHVQKCPSSVTSEDRAAQACEDADLRAIINQALIKRRADVLNSSQESANDSCSSEWDF